MDKRIPTHPIEPDSDSVYLDYGPALPESYHQNRITALIRDPECVFAYWEISALDPNLKSQISNPSISWLLRVHNLSTLTYDDNLLSPPDNPNNIQGSWYLKTSPDTEYQLEIGVTDKTNKYSTLVKSNIFRTPRKVKTDKLFHTTYLPLLAGLPTGLPPALVFLIALLVSSCAALPPQPEQTPQAQTIYAEKGAWLGIVGLRIESGVEVTEVYFNSPAQLAGIKKGDVITALDSKPVSDIAVMLSALAQKKPGDTVKIKVIRTEEQITIISNTDTTLVTIEELDRKYDEVKGKGNPGDKLIFTAVKKDVEKVFDVALTAPPGVLRTTAPPTPVRGGSPQPEMKNGKKAGWLGVGLDGVKDLTKYGMPKDVGGARLTSISPSSPADKGGLKDSDIIIKYDHNGFSGDESKYQTTLADYIKAKGSGAELSLTVLRIIDEAIIDNKALLPEDKDVFDVIKELKVGQQIKASVTKKAIQLEKTIVLGTRMASSAASTAEPEPNEAIHPELASYTTPIEILTNRIMTATNITDKYNDLIKRYGEDQKWDDGLRLRDMRYLQRDPWKIPRVCDEFITNIAVPADFRKEYMNQDYKPIHSHDIDSVNHTLDVIISKLDAQITDEAIAPIHLKAGISLEEHCEQLVKVMELAEAYRKAAFAGMTEDDYKFLQANIIGFTDRWVRDFHFSEPDEIAKRGDIDKRVLQLCSFVNYQKLFASGRIIAAVFSSEYLDGLKKDIETAGQDKEGVLLTKDTPFGKIIISGKGNSQYLEPAAIIIDLDGADFYANGSGANALPDRPFSIIIDYAGNDRYSSYTNGCQGTGIMGAAILIDMQGDDIYIGQNWAQGTGLLGVGILIDEDGNDSYTGQEFVQGAGLFGIGILIDNGAQSLSTYGDRYLANKYAQGFGGPMACGLLVNADGNDFYLAAGKYPNGYPENVGTFEGWAQGCGTGFRCYADWSMSRSGGIGILIDGAGADIYEAGTFSQGGGYFFGWGILYDANTQNDKYLGTRYAQGFAAHSAVGYFVDEGGNDHYKTLCGVNAGLSWDLTTVVFIDKSGDDTYETGGFSIGATAHNGFCLFMDLGGTDTYKGTTAGSAGGNSYHGGSSLSVFLDAGGDEDSYTNRKNNIIETDKEYSIFIDTNKTVEDLVKDDAFKAMLNNKIKEEPKEDKKP